MVNSVCLCYYCRYISDSNVWLAECLLHKFDLCLVVLFISEIYYFIILFYTITGSLKANLVWKKKR